MIRIMSEYNNTELAILYAAEEVFLEKGYNGSSTTKIAEKAGVTHAMLHYYFRSKEKIFLRILDKEVEAMISSVRSVMSPDAGLWETIEKAICRYFDFLDAHRRFPFLMLNVADNNPEMLEKYKRRVIVAVNTEMSRHAERVRKGMETGEINEIDPFQLLYTVLSLSLSTFLSLPLLEKVLKLDEARVSVIIEERKKEILRIVFTRLFGKVPRRK